VSVACPCCRAVNESGPACRRCKADLGLLFALDRQQRLTIESLKHHAVSAAIRSDFAAALARYWDIERKIGERDAVAP
jgi:hypothetical protein